MRVLWSLMIVAAVSVSSAQAATIGLGGGPAQYPDIVSFGAMITYSESTDVFNLQSLPVSLAPDAVPANSKAFDLFTFDNSLNLTAKINSIGQLIADVGNTFTIQGTLEGIGFGSVTGTVDQFGFYGAGTETTFEFLGTITNVVGTFATYFSNGGPMGFVVKPLTQELSDFDSDGEAPFAGNFETSGIDGTVDAFSATVVPAPPALLFGVPLLIGGLRAARRMMGLKQENETEKSA